MTVNHYSNRRTVFVTWIAVFAFGVSDVGRCSDDAFETLTTQLYSRYPTRIYLNVARVRDSYCGHVYLTNLLDNLAESDPSFAVVKELFFLDLDSAFVFTTLTETNLGQAVQSVPPFVVACRGRIDRAKWKQMIAAEKPAIASGTSEVYRVELGGDLRLDQNPVAPIMLEDRDVFIGLLDTNTALLSFGVSEAALRELVVSQPKVVDETAVAEFKKDQEKSHGVMVYGTAPMQNEHGDQSALTKTEMTIDLMDKIHLDFTFLCRSLRGAIQHEATVHEKADQLKTIASAFLAGNGSRGKLFDELFRNLRVDRDSQSIKVSLNVPLAILHMWARNSESTAPVYQNAAGDTVESRDDAEYVILNSVTECQVADEFLPGIPDDGSGRYVRQRTECFGTDASRQPFPNDVNGIAVRIMTYWLSETSNPKMAFVSYEYLDKNKEPACNADGISKKWIVLDAAHRDSLDAKYFGAGGKPLTVPVFVEEVMPDSPHENRSFRAELGSSGVSFFKP